MKFLWSEPLVQFLIIGIGLYFLLDFIAPIQTRDEANTTIVVDEKQLLDYLQFQRKSFDASNNKSILDNMSLEQKQLLVKSYVRDEVLVREALRLGLNKNDEIIRRRLIQKMEYIAQGFYDDIPGLSDEQLQVFFDQRRDQYQIPAAVTFTHVFVTLDSTNRDPSSGLDLKQYSHNLLNTLNRKQVTFSEAGQYGDRFLFNLNYVENDPDTISSHFGDYFAQVLFTLDTNNRWQGPIKSDYGWHLVLITEKRPGRAASLSDVSDQVLADAQREQHRELKNSAIDALIAEYSISNNYLIQ